MLVLPGELDILQLLRQADERCLQTLAASAKVRAKLERIWATSTDHAGQGSGLG